MKPLMKLTLKSREGRSRQDRLAALIKLAKLSRKPKVA